MDYFGPANVHFNSSKFPAFKQNTFAFIVQDRVETKKIIIDFYDSSEIDPTTFNWCDVYGKINITPADYHNQKFKNKLVAIGPGFGIKIWNIPKAIFISLYNFILSYKNLDNYRRFFRNYKAQAERAPIKKYDRGTAEKNYVFMLNSLWKKEATTNLNRTKFIEICKAIPGVKFEGGFAPRTINDVSGFENYTTTKRYSIEDYLEKIKKSSIAFNTPAVLDCLGWKLGEFFALGKAIVSTPILRILPESLTHEENIIILLKDVAESKTIIENFLIDNEMRMRLEDNSYKYYIKYLSPEKVIERLVSQAMEF